MLGETCSTGHFAKLALAIVGWAIPSENGEEPMAQSTLNFVQGGIKDDDGKLAEYGVDPLSDAAIPYYARWMRQDVIGIYYMLSRIKWCTNIGVVLLFVIAFFLWKIAYR
jgi:hypothetical protein